MLSVALFVGCQESSSVGNAAKPAPAGDPVAERPAVKPAGDVKKYGSAADVPRITLEEAKKAFDAGTAVFVDSRPEPAYKEEHIAGAINIPNGANAPEKFSSLPKGKKIIVYCS